MSGVPDCVTCGACCTEQAWPGDEGPFVALYGACSDRFGPSELAEDTAGCDFLRTRTNGPGETRCVFLRGTLGEAVACTAYERRPQVCRDLEAGSPECLSIRAKRFPLP